MRLYLPMGLGLAVHPAAAAAQDSAARRWLADEALATFCQGPGTFGPDGLVEADLTGDGRDDLLIYTGGMSCDDGRPACAAVYCDADLYVRDGDLLVKKLGVNTQCAELASGAPPGIQFCNNDSGPYVLRWNGTEFAP